jgi:cytoskeletal protein RodZ
VFEIGNSLREARVRQQLELTEVELATKIRARYLRALEEEAFEALPAQTYVKGFLRTYADYLGLDGQLYVDEFNSRYGMEGEEPREPVVVRRTSNVRRQHRRLERRWVLLRSPGSRRCSHSRSPPGSSAARTARPFRTSPRPRRRRRRSR